MKGVKRHYLKSIKFFPQRRIFRNVIFRN